MFSLENVFTSVPGNVSLGKIFIILLYLREVGPVFTATFCSGSLNN